MTLPFMYDMGDVENQSPGKPGLCASKRITYIYILACNRSCSTAWVKKSEE
jgi:hypothetical protein